MLRQVIDLYALGCIAGHSPSPSVAVCVADSLVRAEADKGQADEKPGAGDDETDGEDHDLHTWENKGNSAVLELGDNFVDCGLSNGKIGPDHFLGEDAGYKGGFVGRDVRGNSLAGGIDAGKGQSRHDQGFQLRPVFR